MTTTRTDDDMTAELDGLRAVLGLEATLLGDLAYALETERALGCCGRAEWTGRAADDVSRASERLRDAELLRALHVGELASSMGMDPDCTLSELAESMARPWREVLLGHRARLRSAAGDVSRAVSPVAGVATGR